ncbi:hypothetical protein EGW08_000527 [Elysia chlorotica]|uniref:Fibronectin type-III domain-containing protein n=1 Tax=Elysia chlorotica TaxID=188477 RepID=A0A433UCX9_ELYCH|nr:hypothetical protein EGW08_000527 [Elysia chlorotica]
MFTPDSPEQPFHAMVHPTLVLALLMLMASPAATTSQGLTESPPTVSSDHGLSGEAVRGKGLEHPGYVISSPDPLGGKPRTRKGDRKRKKDGAWKIWEVDVCKIYVLVSQLCLCAAAPSIVRQAHKACVNWSPALKVKVNTTEESIWVDYCTDSSSPQTRTCMIEINNSSSSTSPAASQCHILEQGNCTTVFHGLKVGTSYKVMVKPYCRCQERSVDPCAVKVSVGGPYQMPTTTVLESSVIDTAKTKTGSVIFLTTYITVVLAVMAIVFIALTKCTSKRSSNDSSSAAQEDPDFDDTMGISPPTYTSIESRGSDTHLNRLHSGSETILKEACTDDEAETLCKKEYGSAACNSCETLELCAGGPLKRTFSSHRDTTSRTSETSGLLQIHPLKCEETRLCGAGNGTALSTMEERRYHKLDSPEMYAGIEEQPSYSTEEITIGRDQIGLRLNNFREIDNFRGFQRNISRIIPIRTPGHPNEVDDTHQRGLQLHHPQKLHGRISPNSLNMIEIPRDLLLEGTNT